MTDELDSRPTVPPYAPLTLGDVMRIRASRYIDAGEKLASEKMERVFRDFDYSKASSADVNLMRRKCYQDGMRQVLGNKVRVAPRSYL